MNSEVIFLVQDLPEGGYEAKALGYPIFTEADTLDELKLMIKDAVVCHFESEETPKINSLTLCGKE